MVEEQIDWRKTVEAILENANRPFVPISKSFIQQPRGSKERSSVLSQFVTNGDLRGLKAYLLFTDRGIRKQPRHGERVVHIAAPANMGSCLWLLGNSR